MGSDEFLRIKLTLEDRSQWDQRISSQTAVYP